MSLDEQHLDERRPRLRLSTNSFAVRHAVEADAEAIAALHVRAWQWAYRGLLPAAFLEGLGKQVGRREQMWRRQLSEAQPDRRVWVAERSGKIIGFCNATPAQNGELATAELHTLYLDPAVVGTGVGAALMRHALTDLRARGYGAVVLWVLNTNARARRFYEKGGWRTDGAEKTEEIWGTPVQQVRYRIGLPETAVVPAPPPGRTGATQGARPSSRRQNPLLGGTRRPRTVSAG